jgi:outer membrane protein assembly factor BamB
MQKLKSKIATITIAIFLMLSMSASMKLMPTASSHTPPWQVPTYMYISVSPNPVGVGQQVNVNFWVDIPPPNQLGVLGDRWQNLTVVVTAPDGTKKTLGPYPADATGGTFTTYTPATIGNYTFQSFFGGQTLTFPLGAGVGDYYKPSQSTVFTVSVQQQPISGPTVVPLPTSYWTRPIYAENNNWYTVAGNWLGFGLGIFPGVYNATGNYNPYTTAPTTAHILWTKPEAFGGTIGGEFGGSEQSNFYSTRQYEVMFQPVIMNGILYYTEYPGSSTYPAGLVAVDLKTGQTLWTDNAANYGGGSPTQSALTASGTVTNLINGQILNYVSPNQYGGLAYLWTTGTPNGINTAPGTTTYNLLDAMTGNYILSIVNGSAFSAMTEDQTGDLIGYYINSANPNAPTLVEWNSTKAILTSQNDFFTAVGLAVWRPPQSIVIPFSNGIVWTAPLATNISGNPITLGYSGISSGVILLDQYGPMGALLGSAFQSGWIVEAGYSSDNGQLLWGPVNRTENLGTRVSFGLTSNGNSGAAIGDGAWVECDLNALTVTGYNLLTGANMWGPEVLPNANSWDSLGMSQIVANGTIYVWGLGGDVYAINIATGAINWHYQTPSGGVDSPYSVEPLWPSVGRGVVAGGILFVPEGHEFAPPLFHGAQQIALDITDGKVVWSISAMNVNGIHAVADGVMTTLNAYDNQIYGYGQGASATTVAAPQVGVTTSAPVTIRGTVMDISAGSKQQAVAANFPNGLPCVSDASQSLWMEHVYMQQPMPTNVTGVPVTLSVLDSNGNYRQIGTSTTDASGTFAFTWTPDIPGSFTVYATFAGTGSYYASSAETHFYAGAPAPTAAPTAAPQQSVADQYFVPAVAGIIAAIVIGFAITILMQRKRP